ncbi:MAG: SDR family NAD(P)-dependent oxidoreductase [Caulobacterales bacterium]
MGQYHFDLTGRTILVTGASSGLGARFGRILAASGAKVVLAARRAALLEALKQEIETAGGCAIAVSMDVADEDSTKAAFDAAEAAFGPVDSIIANAGTNVSGPALDLEVAGLDAILSVNVRGVRNRLTDAL